MVFGIHAVSLDAAVPVLLDWLTKKHNAKDTPCYCGERYCTNNVDANAEKKEMLEDLMVLEEDRKADQVDRNVIADGPGEHELDCI